MAVSRQPANSNDRPLTLHWSQSGEKIGYRRSNGRFRENTADKPEKWRSGSTVPSWPIATSDQVQFAAGKPPFKFGSSGRAMPDNKSVGADNLVSAG